MRITKNKSITLSFLVILFILSFMIFNLHNSKLKKEENKINEILNEIKLNVQNGEGISIVREEDIVKTNDIIRGD